jgi:hypothetical protein
MPLLRLQRHDQQLTKHQYLGEAKSVDPFVAGILYFEDLVP